MVQALWHSKVDKQQMDAYMDVAVVHKDTEETTPHVTRSSRKRPREEDTNEKSQGTEYIHLVHEEFFTHAHNARACMYMYTCMILHACISTYVLKIFAGNILSRLMETPAKKLRKFYRASAVKSSSLLRSKSTLAKVVANGMPRNAIELVPIAEASPAHLSTSAVSKSQSSCLADGDESVPVRRSPRLKAMVQSKIKSSPNVRIGAFVK